MATLAYRKVDSDNYPIVSGDYLLSINNTVNDWNVILPSPAGITGKVYVIKRFDQNSVGQVIILAAAGLIQNTAGNFISPIGLGVWGTFNESMMFMSNGTNWEYIL